MFRLIFLDRLETFHDEDRMTEKAKGPGRPRLKTKEANIELEKIESQFVEKETEMVNLNMAEKEKIPLQEEDTQTKLSKKQLKDMGYLMIKPARRMGSQQKPNPKWQKEREHAWKMVKAILENKESPGENIEMWTHPFKGDPYDFWKLPTNKPILIPRHLANDVAACNYVQHKMDLKEKNVVDEEGTSLYVGKRVIQTKKARLTASPYVDTFNEASF